MTEGQKRWIEISLLVPHGWDEVLPGFLEGKGFSGLWLDEEGVSPHRLLLRAYMDEAAWKPETEQQLRSHLRALSRTFRIDRGATALTTRVIEEEDWVSKWLPFFQPLKIGSVWIRPSARPVPLAAEEQELILDPGEAFGTGHHESTQLCLESIWRLRPFLADESPILDLGAGTGILAMFAARLGFKDILALDTDPRAVEVALQNLALNGLEQAIRVSREPFEVIGSRFGLIVANLTASIHRELVAQLKGHLNRGGWLVLSGILRNESAALTRLFQAKSLELVHESSKNEWAGLTLKLKEEPFC
jgi:ribosomal protein L11 methyltransferase